MDGDLVALYILVALFVSVMSFILIADKHTRKTNRWLRIITVYNWQAYLLALGVGAAWPLTVTLVMLGCITYLLIEAYVSIGKKVDE